ncbi:MAG TPA: sigma-70 family RNA polymerase sigma factor [Pseudonocardiaceae bacterium]|nr:sigma-70 family RNA polymerase sigma factor [Pseudonocardiaceae bacterium]
MAAVPAEIHGPSDAELIESVRAGRPDAYGPLYERHVSAAYNLARQLARSSAEADDLVSEAFARVLDTLRAGRGPDSAFRAYLLTSLRHVAYDKTRRDKRVELTEDVTTVSGVSTEKISEPFKDTAVAGLERSLAAKAFARLPERWQAVLWHTEIEGQSPAEVAPLLGLTANGVSALAYRAREGLRQAYLQVHLAETTAGRCQATAEKLGAWTRGGLSKRETAQVEAHLDECDRCRALAAELADVNGGLRVIATLVLGAGAAGYLATTAKASAGVALTAAASAGGTSAASGAANAAGSLPRQFAGVGASVAALAAVLAIALTGHTTQDIPAAAAVRPPTTTVQPAPPTAPPAHPAPPAPPAPPATTPTTTTTAPPPATTPATTPVTTTTTPPPPTTTTPPPTTTTPGQPTLSASGPTGGVTLTPGSAAVTVPISVTNTGTALSDPVTAVLHLPPGVSAQPVSSAAGTLSGHSLDAHPIGLYRQAGGQGSTTTVDCPPGDGTVTCTSPSGLGPGDSVELVFRLVASDQAKEGDITGTVTAGSAMAVQITVHVTVNPPPVRDDLRLRAQIDPWDSWWTWLWDGSPILDVTVTNTGTSTKPVTVTVDRPGSIWSSHPPSSCDGSHAGVTCTTDDAVKPGQTVHLRFRLYHLRPVRATITVTATLGQAHQATTVRFTPPRCEWVWCWPEPPGPPSGTPTPSGTPDSQPPPSTTTTDETQPPSTKRHHPPTTTATTPPPRRSTTTTTTPPTSTKTDEPPTSTQPPPGTKTPPTCPSSPPGPGKLHPGATTGCGTGLLPTLFSLLGPV